GIATVRLMPADRDELPTDNIAHLVIPPAKRLSAVLVTEGNLFTKSALEGLNLSKFDVKTPGEFQAMLDKHETAQYDVFVFDRNLANVAVPDKKAGPGLPPGRSLVLGAVPSPEFGIIDQGPGEGEVIAAYNRDHPALRLAALDKLNIAKSRKVKIDPEAPI